jgi:protein arginine N-methyltransferase 6
MLGSVLHARDAWLRHGGRMLPSHATLWCAPLSDEARYDDTATFWDEDVYGIDMRSLAPLALRCAFAEPIVESCPPACIMTWPVRLRRIDMGTLKHEEVLPWEGPFQAAAMGRGPCHGLALWFDVEFHSAATEAAAAAVGGDGAPMGVGVPQRAPPPGAAPPVTLATGPDDPATHWMTTLLYLDAPLQAEQDALIRGTLRMQPHAANERFLTLRLTMEVEGSASGSGGGGVEKTFDMT